MKNVRILIVVALIAVLVILAQGGVGAWTAKLQANPNAVAPAPVLGARPQGTVGGSPIVALGPDECTLVIASFCATSDETGLSIQAITEMPAGVTAPEGLTVFTTRMVQITGTGDKTTETITFTLDPALTDTQVVAYWDGTKWVTLTAVDGTYTVPVGAPLPLVIAVMTK